MCLWYESRSKFSNIEIHFLIIIKENFASVFMAHSVYSSFLKNYEIGSVLLQKLCAVRVVLIKSIK